MCITLEKAGFLRGREECIVDIVLSELRHEKRFYSIRLGVNCKDSVELAHTSILHLIVQTLVHFNIAHVCLGKMVMTSTPSDVS